MQVPDGYVKVSPVLLQAEEPLKIDLFIHMPRNKKVVLFLKKGSILTTEKLLELMRTPSSQLLTTPEDSQEAVDHLAQTIAENLEKHDDIDEKTKETMAHILQALGNAGQGTQGVALTETKLLFDESAILVEKIIKLMSHSDEKIDFEQLLSQLKNENHLDTHHRHTSALATIFLLSFGEGNAKSVLEMAFSGMAHDLGLSELPEDEILLHTQGVETLALHSSDNSEYAMNNTQHIASSIRLLKEGVLKISETIFQIILQHHENYDGSGPAGISGSKIHPLARILRITDDLIALIGESATQVSTLDRALDILKTANIRSNEPCFYDPKLIAQIEKISRSAKETTV
jgi:HD-GYP domain-containing protein (c-di-GMP phosphodiesterase class II)